MATARQLRSMFQLYDDGTEMINALGQVFVVPPNSGKRITDFALRNNPDATIQELGKPDEGKTWKWYPGRLKKDGTPGLGHWGQVKLPRVVELKEGYEWREVQCKRTLKSGEVKMYVQRRQVKKIKTETVARAKKGGYTKTQLREIWGMTRPSTRIPRPDDALMEAFGYLQAA